MKKLFLLLAPCSLLFASCKTAEVSPRTTTALRESVALGTQVAMVQHPEWRPAFLIASSQLRTLAAQDQINLDTLLTVFSQLPVDELGDTNTKFIFAGARLFLALNNWSDVEVVQTEQLRPVALAIADGIDAGLASNVSISPHGRVGLGYFHTR